MLLQLMLMLQKKKLHGVVCKLIMALGGSGVQDTVLPSCGKCPQCVDVQGPILQEWQLVLCLLRKFRFSFSAAIQKSHEKAC